jgi:hypothetical protein
MVVLDRRGADEVVVGVPSELSEMIDSAPRRLLACQSAGIPAVFPGRRVLPRTMFETATFDLADGEPLPRVSMVAVDESLDSW